MRDKRAKYGVCKANFVLALKETMKVSHMSPKSGPSVLKTKETKGTYVYLLYAFYFMRFAFSPYHLLFSTRVVLHHPP